MDFNKKLDLISRIETYNGKISFAQDVINSETGEVVFPYVVGNDYEGYALTEELIDYLSLNRELIRNTYYYELMMDGTDNVTLENVKKAKQIDKKIVKKMSNN